MKNPNGYCNHRMRFKEWPVLNWLLSWNN
jgi:hypothetical protein